MVIVFTKKIFLILSARNLSLLTTYIVFYTTLILLRNKNLVHVVNWYFIQACDFKGRLCKDLRVTQIISERYDAPH